MIFYIILTISILTNIFAIWYIWNILQKLLFVAENIEDLRRSLYSFTGHLESLYELETYYGDEHLESLISHSKQVCEDIEEFEEIYSLTLGEEAEHEREESAEEAPTPEEPREAR